MNIRILSNKLLFVILTLWSINTQAQVTIGSTLKPRTGALLDLKEFDNGITSSLRGLGLPRVSLDSLVITGANTNMATTIKNSDGVWDKDEHIGLVVFNTNESNSCNGGVEMGLYVWGGEKWEALMSNESTRPPLGTGTDQYDGANTYIVLRNETITIPVKRAFQIWNEYGNGSNNTATGHVLPVPTTYFTNYTNGTLTAEVIWQEAFDASESNVLASTAIAINRSTPIEESSFSITAGSKSGNALVALKLNGIVMWQWQIWVPANDPTLNAYGYKTDGSSYWFMDRYLGAVSSEKKQWDGNMDGTGGTSSNRNAHGLYYQWGRPTPIKKFGATISTHVPTNVEKDNLLKAIQSPAFIISDSISIGNTTSQDWYSNTNQWTIRWGDGTSNETGNKTPFDPCPKGWRIPGRKSSQPPWLCLDLSNKSYSAAYSGYNFTDPGRTLGYYPIAGYRARSSGLLYDVGNIGSIWSSTPAGNGGSQRILFDKNSITPASRHYRANGLSVRCVQDN